LEPRSADDARWQRMIDDLMAEAGATSSAEVKLDCLREAAQIYERHLADLPRALVTWQAAFAEAPASDDVALAVERVTESLGRWDSVLADTAHLLADVTEPEQRTALLIWLARWRERFGQDEAAAEEHLAEAAALSPGSVAAAEALTELYRRHGEWSRAAAVLARTGNVTTDPQEAVALLLEAARLLHTRVGDTDAATPLYRRVLEIDPANVAAVAALADLGPGLDPEAACIQYRRAFEADPDDLSVIRQWANVAFANGRWDDVRFLFEKLYARVDSALAAEFGRGDPRPRR
jgi:golgin subfamily B member 1